MGILQGNCHVQSICWSICRVTPNCIKLSFLVWVLEPHPSALRHVAGGRDDEIELDMDLRKTLWALHELCVNSERGKMAGSARGEGLAPLGLLGAPPRAPWQIRLRYVCIS